MQKDFWHAAFDCLFPAYAIVRDSKKIGLFPTTESDVENFEKNNDIENTIIPESLQDPSTILKKGRITKK